MSDDMENTLNEYTDKVFKVVAECFSVGNDKGAKKNVKEMLRIVWHEARAKTCREVGSTVCELANKIIQDKGW